PLKVAIPIKSILSLSLSQKRKHKIVCTKTKNRPVGRFLVVEPRGIEPLYPSVDHGFLTVRWPLKLHENIITFLKQKKKDRE
ncbi:MAG: hypothetical protein WC618_03460, partial [Patescibacteria group bacterium]